MTTQHYTVRIPTSVADDLAIGHDYEIRDRLADFRAVLDAERPRFSLAEALLLAEALNGVQLDANSARLLWAEVQEACRRQNLGAKYDVDVEALIARLLNLSLVQSYAVLLAVHRWWQGTAGDPAQGFREVGLI